MIPFNVLSGGALGKMWPAFYRQGLWVPATAVNGGMELTAAVENGDTLIRVNALQNGTGGDPIVTNLWEPVRTDPPGYLPGAGYGKLLRLDPIGENIEVEIRHVDPFHSDSGAGDVVIYLETPVEGIVGANIPAAKLIGMGHSPVLSIGSENRKIAIIAASHGFDDRGNPRTEAPGIDLTMYVADNQKGPFIASGPVPGGVGFVDATDEEELLSQGLFELPPNAFLKFTAEANGGDDGETIFSLFVSRAVIS
jgi:hypothetical protein